MTKPIWKGAAALAVTAAVAACALVASSAASTGSSAAAKTPAASGSAPCILPIVHGALAAMKAGSGRRRDLVTNQYDLPTPSTVSPFFSASHTVNVYFHVIMDDSGINTPEHGAIPQQWMTDQITVLNDAYASSGFKFVRETPDFTINPDWFFGLVPGTQEKAMKTLLHTGGYWDLNVYTASLGGGLLGWATFPEKHAQGKKVTMDGVVVDGQSLPGGNLDLYNQGDTLTHEAGHWLSLYHTFQGGCSKKGDQVDDTPAESDPNYNCIDTNSCPKLHPGVDDLIHNFMDYGDDICLDSFTPGQSARMEANWDRLRNLVPAIKSFTPGKALVGASVTIKGSALTGATAVSFNGTPATTFAVVGDATITATVPVGATTGTVVVTGPNGTGTSSKVFKVEI
jgi:Pregnancy-associated plasma protein-A/IPT/TIG domain